MIYPKMRQTGPTVVESASHLFIVRGEETPDYWSEPDGDEGQTMLQIALTIVADDRKPYWIRFKPDELEELIAGFRDVLRWVQETEPQTFSYPRPPEPTYQTAIPVPTMPTETDTP